MNKGNDDEQKNRETEYELITIRFSHYNEKARWACDYFQICSKERPHVPILHMPPVYFATRKYKAQNKADNISTSLSTPVLIEKTSGTILCDSTDILRYLDGKYGSPDSNSCQYKVPTLYPSKYSTEIMNLEKRVHDRLGPNTRRMAYYYVLADSKLSKRIALDNLGNSLQAYLFYYGFGFVKNQILSQLLVTKDRVVKSLDIVRKEFEYYGELLEKNGTGYLIGDRFTAADLSFACMASVVLLVQPEEGYGAKLPSNDEVTQVFGDISKELRNTIAGRHAMRMFKDHRPSPQIPCKPIIISRL
jgi:glutathione S-transferase